MFIVRIQFPCKISFLNVYFIIQAITNSIDWNSFAKYNDYQNWLFINICSFQSLAFRLFGTFKLFRLYVKSKLRIAHPVLPGLAIFRQIREIWTQLGDRIKSPSPAKFKLFCSQIAKTPRNLKNGHFWAKYGKFWAKLAFFSLKK